MKGGSIARRAEIGRERRDKMARKLIQSAAEVIATLGADKATIDDFISAAGVARGTFYNYFKTREALLDELWNRVGYDPYLEIRTACERIEDPGQRFTTMTRLILRKTLSDATWGWLVFAKSGSAENVNPDLLTYPSPVLHAGLEIRQFQFDDFNSGRDMVVSTVRSAMRAILIGEAGPNYVDSVMIMILRAVGLSDADARRLNALPLPE